MLSSLILVCHTRDAEPLKCSLKCLEAGRVVCYEGLGRALTSSPVTVSTVGQQMYFPSLHVEQHRPPNDDCG